MSYEEFENAVFENAVYKGKHVTASVTVRFEDGIITLSVSAGLRKHVGEFAVGSLTPDDIDDDLARLVAEDVKEAVIKAVSGDAKREIGRSVMIDCYRRVSDNELIMALHELRGDDDFADELRIAEAEAIRRGVRHDI